MALLLLLVPMTSAAQEGFEGILRGTFSITAGPGDIALYVAPEGLRAEVTVYAFPFGEQREVFLLRSTEPERIYRIDPDERTYRVLDVDEATARALRPGATFQVERRGTSEVAGLPAQRTEVTTDEGVRFEVWTSPAVPDDAAVLRAIGVDATEGLLAALDQAGLQGAIVRLFHYPAGSDAPSVSFEVTSIERRDIAPSLLQLPSWVREDEPVPSS